MEIIKKLFHPAFCILDMLDSYVRRSMITSGKLMVSLCQSDKESAMKDKQRDIRDIRDTMINGKGETTFNS